MAPRRYFQGESIRDLVDALPEAILSGSGFAATYWAYPQVREAP
jgi:hypothetical protein